MKKRRIYYLGGLIGLVIGLMGYKFVANYLSPTPAPELKTTPYSIASFRQREYPGSEIKIERLVRETNEFRSYVVAYQSDGMTLFALMNIPKSPMPTQGYPVIIVNHGYIDPAIFSTENSYINTSAYYAQNGFLVLKPDYRGHAKSGGEARHFFSRIEYAVDVANLISSLSSLPEANTKKVFLYGHSMGGDVTLRLLEMSDQITAATLWAPAVTDFPESHLYFMRQNGAGELMANEQELENTLKPEEYREASVIEHLELINSPLLIHHSTTDDRVPYGWGETLNKKLLAKNKTVTMYSYRGDNHDIGANWSTALNRDIEFFRSFLTD